VRSGLAKVYRSRVSRSAVATVVVTPTALEDLTLLVSKLHLSGDTSIADDAANGIPRCERDDPERKRGHDACDVR